VTLGVLIDDNDGDDVDRSTGALKRALETSDRAPTRTHEADTSKRLAPREVRCGLREDHWLRPVKREDHEADRDHGEREAFERHVHAATSR